MVADGQTRLDKRRQEKNFDAGIFVAGTIGLYESLTGA
jgi:hypothetical protein